MSHTAPQVNGWRYRGNARVAARVAHPSGKANRRSWGRRATGRDSSRCHTPSRSSSRSGSSTAGTTVASDTVMPAQRSIRFAGRKT